MQEEDKGISLRDIFKVIASQKWLALIIAAVITLAGTLFVYFGINKLKNNYVARFSITLPGNNSGTNYVYPDGTLFNYSDIVQYANLESVKSTQESFADLDVGAMVDSGDISISRTSESVGTNEYVYYTLSIQAKYFVNYAQARSFMVAVAQTPKNRFSDINVDYGVYLNQSKEAYDYETEIELLESQLLYLQSEYEALTESLGGNFSVNGRTISSYAADVASYMNGGNLDILLARLRGAEIPAIKSERSKNNLGFRITTLENQLAAAENTLKALQNSVADSNPNNQNSSAVKTQSDLVEKIKGNLAAARNSRDKGIVDNNKFGEEYIKTEYDEISKLTNTYKEVVSEANAKSTAVSFMRVNAVSAEGGYGLTTIILLSLLVGIVVALIVAFIVGNVKNKKQQALPQTVQKEDGNLNE